MSKDVHYESFNCYHTPMLYSEYFSCSDVPSTWPDPPTTTSGSKAPGIEEPSRQKQPRWPRINMGFIQQLLKAWLINISDKAAVSLTIIITCLISILDTATDIAIAYLLFSSKNENAQNWGVVILMCDYFPSWQLAAHNISSRTWRTQTNRQEKLIMMIFLAISPFSLPLFFLRWLINFDSPDLKTFDYLHHNARLSHLLSFSLEAPIQLVLLLVLWGEGLLPLPWIDTFCITDTQGRHVCLYTGIFSLIMSLLSVIKGSMEVSEGPKWTDQAQAAGYAICNLAFRLPSYALLILYFNEWSVILFFAILFINYTFMVRYDTIKKKEFHVLTSVVMMMLTPIVSSDQPHKFQTTDIQGSTIYKIQKNNKNRRNLSANISMITSFMVFISNLILLLTLKLDSEFVARGNGGNIILERNTTENILQIFLLPMGGVALLSSVMYRIDDLKTQGPSYNYFGVDFIINLIANRILTVCKIVSLVLAVAVTIVLFGITASIMKQHIANNNIVMGLVSRTDS
jgi:hypothetical protein